jgi:hypothetical protein
MATTFNPGDLTFNGKEIDTIREAFIQEHHELPEINAFHTILEGIKGKQQIVIAGLLGNVGKESIGCPPECDGEIPFAEKTWDPVDIDIRLCQCWSELLPSFLAWGMNCGISKKDLRGTDYWNFVQDRIMGAYLEAVLRIAWLSDTTEDNIANAGNITDGVDPLYYTMSDGFWPQAIAITTTTPAQRFVIPENAGITYAAQKLATTSALDIFEGLVYDAADFRLRSAPNQVIVVTQTIADNYAQYLRTTGGGCCDAYNRIEGGYTTLAFEGIPVISFNMLDRKIRSDFDSGTFWHLPNRALYTTIDNLVIGTDCADTEIKVWYNDETTNNGMDISWRQDQKLVVDHLVAAAY